MDISYEIAPAFCGAGYEWNKSPTENDITFKLEYSLSADKAGI